jgi:mutator protein MutT
MAPVLSAMAGCYTAIMTKQIHAVGVILEDENQQILVLRRHPSAPEGTTWGLVGGKLEPDESKEAAAIRETQEEIGYAIEPSQLQFLQTYHWDRDDLDITFEVFRLRVPAGSVNPQVNQVESTEYMWASPHELYARKDLMVGLYPILVDVYQTEAS